MYINIYIYKYMGGPEQSEPYINIVAHKHLSFSLPSHIL